MSIWNVTSIILRPSCPVRMENVIRANFLSLVVCAEGLLEKKIQTVRQVPHLRYTYLYLFFVRIHISLHARETKWQYATVFLFPGKSYDTHYLLNNVLPHSRSPPARNNNLNCESGFRHYTRISLKIFSSRYFPPISENTAPRNNFYNRPFLYTILDRGCSSKLWNA